MKKLLVFTDIHSVAQGESIIGLDPMDRFSRGLAHALDHHPDAERIVITGDLAHHGAHDEYMRLHAALKDCPLPISITLGNHDRRSEFLKVFQNVALTDTGYVQEAIDLGDTRLVVLDTLDEHAPDLHSGLLCEQRLTWMETAIQKADGRRVLIFMHHPPILTGFPGMDSIGLRNRTELANRLGAHENVVLIVAGHIHRTIQGALSVCETRHIPVAMLKSPCHQMPMRLATDDHHISVDEPGAYGIVLSTTDGVLVHTEDFTL